MDDDFDATFTSDEFGRVWALALSTRAHDETLEAAVARAAREYDALRTAWKARPEAPEETETCAIRIGLGGRVYVRARGPRETR